MSQRDAEQVAEKASDGICPVCWPLFSAIQAILEKRNSTAKRLRSTRAPMAAIVTPRCPC